MPASVGASPGTSVSDAPHISAAKPKPMPANAAPSALRAARRLRSTRSRSRTAIARPITSPTGNPPVAAPSIGSPDIATAMPAAGETGRRLLEALARLRVEVGGRLVVADRRVRGPAVLGEPVRGLERVLDGDDMGLAADRREHGADPALVAGALEAGAGEHDRRLRARLRREALLEHVLRLLGLDARDGEVVLERAAGKDRAGQQRDQHGDDGERRGSGAAPDQRRETGERGGHERKNTQTQSKIKLSLNSDAV